MQPPSSGNSWLGVTTEVLSVDAVYDWCVQPQCGAVVLFSGTVRDHAVDGSGSVRNGVTTFADNYFFMDDVAHVVERTGVRVRTVRGLGYLLESPDAAGLRDES